ncbi:nephrin-like [Leptidea sinapis]|uniref:nephrin-like n=1 Tax=Leptidea sinapis TaxID=189913 RepID=UPI0021C486B1|nr:nephrin-like [Leptidea sinapis]
MFSFDHMWTLVVFFAVVAAGECFVETDQFMSDLDKPVPTAHVGGVMGKKASLPCDTQPLSGDDQIAMVLWFKEPDWEPLYSYDVRGRTVYQPKLWSSPNGFGSRAYFRATATPATLLVDGVTSSDSGIYRCRVDFKNSPTRNLRINFTVIIPSERPVIMDAKTRSNTRLLEPFDEGDDLELLCETHGGDPRPSLIWYLENTIIDDSFEHQEGGITTNTLSFPRVGRQHLNARLICRSSNTKLAPPLSRLLILDINLRPLTVQITNKSSKLSADHDYRIKCRSTGSRPPAVITWWKGVKLLRKNIQYFSDSNSTTSVVILTPEAEDHNVKLTCRADNPRIHDAVIQDSWKLNVHYIPIVTLKFGSNLNPHNITVGDDVYFECRVQANPKATKLSWFKQGVELRHNPQSGVILSESTLVLQQVSRGNAGDYSCAAMNEEGTGSSNDLNLIVRYSPKCDASVDGQAYGALRSETVQLLCKIDSNPPPSEFIWAFNNSGEYKLIKSSISTSLEYTSTILYTPVKDEDFGTILCSASNSAGRQAVPCVFTVYSVARPSAVHNCSVNQTSQELAVQCSEGMDGGLPQMFYMELLQLPAMVMHANITSNVSTFSVADVDLSFSYLVNLYAANSKGRSDVVTLHTTAVRPPDRFIGGGIPGAITPMMVLIVGTSALLSAVVCAITGVLYRRHTSQHRKHQPSTNELYMDGSVESMQKRENLSTYAVSPKIDYNSQFELKAEPGEEEPDIILTNKKLEVEYNKTLITEADALSSFDDRAHSLTNNYNISVVNRGVTASSADILASRSCPLHLPTSASRTFSSVRESCI